MRKINLIVLHCSATRETAENTPDRNGDGWIMPDEWLNACPCFNAGEEYGDL